MLPDGRSCWSGSMLKLLGLWDHRHLVRPVLSVGLNVRGGHSNSNLEVRVGMYITHLQQGSLLARWNAVQLLSGVVQAVVDVA